MIRKLLFFVCVLMSLTASSMQNKGSESRKEIELREVKDTVTHDVVHSKRKVPSMKPNIPVVEYIPEESQLVFESSVYQLISFYITDCTQTEIIHSEYLELSPDCEYVYNLYGLVQDEELYLYIYINGILYVGDLK